MDENKTTLTVTHVNSSLDHKNIVTTVGKRSRFAAERETKGYLK